MSLKSRRKQEERKSDKQQHNPLETQKQIIKKTTADYFGGLIMMFVMTVVVLITGFCVDDPAHAKGIFLIVIPLMLLITAIFVFLFTECWMVFRKIKQIQCASEESVTIQCKKVSFLLKHVSRFSSIIICIILTDENGKKYYHITEGISEFSKKSIKNKLLHSKIDLVCYQNTNFIKKYPC